MSDAGDHKNAFIQVWRGIAVLLVISYHFTSRVSPQALGAQQPPSLTFFSGRMGVMIFFIISGYLIAQSLTASSNLAAFFAKRLSRLWPLFLLASVTIFIAMLFLQPPVVIGGPNAFLERRAGFADLIGNCFFLADFGFTWVDGAFWSILVELKFYFLIGVLAWLTPKRHVAVFSVVAFFAASLELACHLVDFRGERPLVALMNGVLIAQHAPFFAIGALLSRNDERDLLTLNMILAACKIGLQISGTPPFNLYTTLVFALMLIAFLAIDAASLDRRIFRTIGDYSYSWYLFHQLIGLSLIRLWAPRIGIDAAALMALASTFLICIAGSWLAEWRFRRTFYVVINAALTRLRLDRAKVGTAALEAGQP